MGIYRYWLENLRAVADFRAKYKILDNVLVRLDNPEDSLEGSIFHNGLDAVLASNHDRRWGSIPPSSAFEGVPQRMEPLNLSTDAERLQNNNGGCKAE